MDIRLSVLIIRELDLQFELQGGRILTKTYFKILGNVTKASVVRQAIKPIISLHSTGICKNNRWNSNDNRFCINFKQFH